MQTSIFAAPFPIKNAKYDIKEGLAVYYTNAWPFTEYYTAELEVIAAEKGNKIRIMKLETREQFNN